MTNRSALCQGLDSLGDCFCSAGEPDGEAVGLKGLGDVLLARLDGESRPASFLIEFAAARARTLGRHPALPFLASGVALFQAMTSVRLMGPLASAT
eukprot:6697782-Alexandrium_andersonii.AAC.1